DGNAIPPPVVWSTDCNLAGPVSLRVDVMTPNGLPGPVRSGRMGRHRPRRREPMTRHCSLLLVLAAPLLVTAAPALKTAGDRLLYVNADDDGMQVWSVRDDG